MNTNVLQSMLAINADRIANIEIAIGDLLDKAAKYKVEGETAFREDAFRKLGHARRKMAKAVDTQRRMKAELTAIFSEARLPGKVALLARHGFVYHIDAGLITHENERRLDAAIASLVPKKADSRTPEQIEELTAAILAKQAAKQAALNPIAAE